jgi:hypothetical protein
MRVRDFVSLTVNVLWTNVAKNLHSKMLLSRVCIISREEYCS